ncbi:leucine-rich repeat and calponin homology domain-containing protein 1 isoform X2 [Bufo bufo]|uniref:leucine-rich repeat and calponin homology domain-containing protein 1 isoform X2 n=1 Tax=Bufo bufo TaxID=8384 RepID=UPI001ABDEDC3|nr:leucine-rich repeat and calponin homology domain-containing protein 1 isoform X2 [Bufo bufo]
MCGSAGVAPSSPRPCEEVLCGRKQACEEKCWYGRQGRICSRGRTCALCLHTPEGRKPTGKSSVLPLPASSALYIQRAQTQRSGAGGKMATLGSESQPFSNLPVSALLQSQYPQQQQHHSAVTGVTNFSLNLPVNRGLERALEEAANSGILNLSARKLKEFPRTSGNHDLSDTVQADFSKNRLTEVPVEVCHFVSLEALNLHQNCIKVIPDSLANLQMLTYLNISRNQLSSLPTCICGLPLKVLIASNNKLGFLPEEIGQLQQLMELDISCNEITSLPHQIGLLKSLRELNVRRNYLKVLPQEIVDLPLVKLDFSCNKILILPLCFRKMVQLQVLVLENNPLQSPPAQICIKGKIHIFKYLSIQACQMEKTGDAFYLHAIERPILQQHVEESIEDIFPLKKDSDSGVGSDSGEKRLSTIEPCDEDSASPSVPMSDILEEENFAKEDLDQQFNNSLKENHQNYVLSAPVESEKSICQYKIDADANLTEFRSYNQAKSADFDEPLQIQEDTTWSIHHNNTSSESKEINSGMIDQLREAVDMLQDPTRLRMEIEDNAELYSLQTTPSDVNKSTVNGQVELQMSSIAQNDDACYDSQEEAEDGTPTMSPAHNTTTFGLKPRSVFVRPQRNLEAIDPQFTMRRKMEQMREEKELLDCLRENIEVRLKICLPEDLGSALMDGVVLCHLANQIRPRSVGSIHVPSPAVPKLSMAKCRRNVENFLDACRKMGVPEEKLCLPHHILEEKGLVKVSITVQALVDVATTKQALFL